MRLTHLSVLIVTLCVVLASALSDEVRAQGTIGVSWQVPENIQTARSELETFQQSGIQLLEVTGTQNAEVWQQIEERGFRVYGNLNLRFPLARTFADADSAFLADLYSSVRHFVDQPSVEAVGIFKYGAIHKAAFDSAVRPVLSNIRSRFDGNLYYTKVHRDTSATDKLFDFSVIDIRVEADQEYFSAGSDTLTNRYTHLTYRPDPTIAPYLTPFHNFMNRFAADSAVILVPSNWLLPTLDKYPELANTISHYNSETELIFPVPAEDYRVGTGHNLIVLLLILIWGTMAVTYHMSPVYRKSAVRFFLGHTFFVEDVMNRHIRSVGAATTILIQNILFAGITIYCLGHVWSSPLGLESLFYHLPVLSILQNPMLSLFVWACLLATALTAISILWIKFANKQVSTFRQVLNLYAWPLQINFLLGTILVSLLMAGNYPLYTIIFSLMFALVHISAFIVTTIDTSKYLGRQKSLFLIGSLGVYLLLWAASAYWFFHSGIPDILQLAFNL